MDVRVLREVEVEAELRQVGVDGVLLYSAFEAEYLETYPGL
jgi:hypothetical protein